MSPLWFLDGAIGDLFNLIRLRGDEGSTLPRFEFKLLFKLVVVAVPILLDVDCGLKLAPPLLLLLPTLFLLLPNLPNRLPFLIGDEKFGPLAGISLKSKCGVGSGKSKTRLELGLDTMVIYYQCLFLNLVDAEWLRQFDLNRLFGYDGGAAVLGQF